MRTATQKISLVLIAILISIISANANASLKDNDKNCKYKSYFDKNKNQCEKHKDRKGIDVVIQVTEIKTVTAVDGDTPLIGIKGSKGNDTVTNHGVVTVSHTSSTTSTSLKALHKIAKNIIVTHHGKHDNDNHKRHYRKKHDSDYEYEDDERDHYATVSEHHPISISSIPADVIGIATGKGNDTIINNGVLSAANTTTLTNKVGHAGSVVIGIKAGKGNDDISNNGSMLVASKASVLINDFIFSFIDLGTDADARQQASAVATGISAGSGNDEINNNGVMTVIADATIDSKKFTAELIGGAKNIKGAVTALAIAQGIDAGTGDDIVTNSGTLNVDAIADIDTVDVKLTAIDLGAGGTTTQSIAAAVGIHSGDGDDTINNSGDIKVTAKATTDTTNVDVSILDISVFGAGGDSSTSATSNAIGINSGKGDDTIVNSGNLIANSIAETTVFGFSWSADGLSDPNDLGKFVDYFRDTPLVDAGTTAESNVVGINMGKGDDSLSNSGLVSATATAKVTSTDVGVGFPFPSIIPITLPGIDVSETATQASANATAVSMGEGDDVLKNSGTILSKANSNANTNNISVTIEPSLGGGNPNEPPGFSWSIEGNLVDLGAYSNSESMAVATGKGDDQLHNTNNITASAKAGSTAVNASVTLAQSDNTVEFNLALANISTVSQAVSTAIDMASGDDAITNDGSIVSNAMTDTNSVAVDVDLKLLSDTKLSLAAKFVDANTKATSDSIVITTGNGDDIVINNGAVTATTKADAASTTVIVGIKGQPGKGFGVIGQGNIASTDTIAEANSLGVTTGSGKDKIKNIGTIKADSTTVSTSVAVGVTGTLAKKGAAIGLAVATANTKSDSTSTGVSTGKDKDFIFNEGLIGATSNANATSGAVSVEVDVVDTGLGVGVSYSKATTEADSQALGIDGGSGKDKIINTGTVRSHANSEVDVVAVAATIGGAKKGITLKGAAADGSSTASSTATGINGGKGKDIIINKGLLDVVADSEADITSVSVTAQGVNKGIGAGVALARATTKSESNNVAIFGGKGSDFIKNLGTLNSKAKSDASAIGVGVSLGLANKGLTFTGTAVDSSTLSNANNNAIMGGSGNDVISNSGTLLSDGFAKARSTGVSVDLNGAITGGALGVSLARATTEAHANSAGLSGGSGNDKIFNKEHLISIATADSASVGVSVSAGAVGKGLALKGSAVDASAISDARAMGIDGGSGKNKIINLATIDSTAFAITRSTSASVSISGAGTGVALGVALSRATTDATANSTGIRLGSQKKRHRKPHHDDEDDDDDRYQSSHHKNKKIVSFRKKYRHRSRDDDDDDHEEDNPDDDHHKPKSILVNSGKINSTATANSKGTSVSVSAELAGVGLAAGVAAAQTSVNATAQANGIEGSRGRDLIVNKGVINATSDADAVGTAVAVALNVAVKGVALGATFTDATTNAIATSSGINAGRGSDKISNLAAINSTATADAKSASISVNGSIAFVPGGAAFADLTSIASSEANAINGGSGNDTINSIDTLTSTATSKSTGTSVAVNIGLGVAFGEAAVIADSYANGIDGGSGHDAILHKGSIKTSATSNSTGTIVSASFVGAGISDSSNIALSNAVAIDGNLGNDWIKNIGLIESISIAKAKGTSVSVTLAGASFSDVSNNATANTVGIDGGGGNDVIQNTNKITSTSSAEATATSVSVTVAGAAFGDFSNRITATSIGIDGGSNDDTVFNNGDLTLTSTATSKASTDSWSFVGASLGDATISANANIIGIDGGAGDDWVKNTATITMSASGSASSKARTISILAGAAITDASLTSNVNVVGIHGNVGNDVLKNYGIVKGGSSASITASSFSYSTIGASLGAMETSSYASGTGMDGGGNNDVIFNTGTIDLDNFATAKVGSSSLNIIGASKSSDSLTANARTTGISGGSGNDWIANDALTKVTSRTNLNLKSKSISIVGSSHSNGSVSGGSITVGLDGGTGEDIILNNGQVTTRSTASFTKKGSSYTFAGSGKSGGLLTADTTSIGINGGSEDDIIHNSGNISSRSYSDSTVSDAVNTTFGSGKASSMMSANARATGIDGGSGDDNISNLGSINVYASSESSSSDSSYTFAGSSASNSVINALTVVSGIVGGAGNDSVFNEGEIRVNTSTKNSNNGSSYSEFGNARTGGLITTRSISNGITTGIGNDIVINKGIIAVDGHTYSYSKHDSNTGILFGGGDAVAKASTSISSYGVDLGSGNNQMQNDNLITVALDGQVITRTSSDGADIFDGDAYSRSESTVNADSIGIRASNGDNLIINNGSVNVKTTRATSDSYAYADGDGIDGDGTVRSYATSNVFAAGIQVGTGANNITNNGNINVNLVAEAKATSSVDSDAGGSSSTGRAGRVKAKAIGISTASGNDLIVNTGKIAVRATATSSTSILHALFDTSSTGISSGAGNDHIVNKGTITADRVINGITLSGTVIDTGSGDDVVSLMKFSTTNGLVKLNEGNDTLHVYGSSILSGDASGGTGNDTVIFDGSGEFSSTLTDFQNTVKQGSGIYSLTELASMEKINVLDGTLRVDNDYQFNLDGTFVPAVATGQSGTFEVTGTVTLAGNINVIRGRGHYMDGDKYDILKATGGFLADSNFDDVIVPKKAPLLKFEYLKDDNTLQIKTDVEAFDTVASSDDEHAIASYLDSVLANADGDVSAVLGEIQALGVNEHSAAFSKLSPENYTRLSHVALSSVQKYNTNLHQRMRTLREERLFNKEFQYNPYSVRFIDNLGYMRTQPAEFRNLFNKISDTVNANNGFWLKGLRQSGAVNNTAQFNKLGFNQNGHSLGFDGNINNNWVVGGSYGFVGTVLDVDAGNAGDIESTLYSFYSSYFSEKSYLDWTFSHGSHDYLNLRSYNIGLADINANSEHTANIITSSLASGYYIPFNNKRLELFSSLQYIRQDENGVNETGGTGISIAAYETQTLTSQLGARFGHHFSKRSYRLYSEVSLGWLHEFELDNEKVTTSFAGVSGRGFTLEQQRLADDGLLFSTGLVFSNRYNLQTALDYTTELRKDYSSQNIMGSVRYKF